MSKIQGYPVLDIYVKDFDDAIKKVINLLCDDTTEGKTKAFILREWIVNDLAICLFRAIAKHLKSTICDDSDMRKHFGKIFHVDCSLCKSARTMQRAIAEELDLRHVMPIFDKHDEDDDFRGVDDISRGPISSIGSLINESLRNENFLMIFHCGGVGEIDLAEFGIPLFGRGKLLCGSDVQEMEDMVFISSFANTNIRLLILDRRNVAVQLRHLLHEEAVAVIGDIGLEGIDPAKVLDCLLYSLFVTTGRQARTYADWATHACNYWICDGILGEEDRAWEIANALYRVMLPLGYYASVIPDSAGLPYIYGGKIQSKLWWSVTSGADDINYVPDSASSCFLMFNGDGPVYAHNVLFQLANNNLRVLKLCNCSFDFASLPIQCCHSLRFLGLDHCTNTRKEQSKGPVFPNLLVFDVRFTDNVLLPQMIELMTNLRELNTKGVSWKTMSHAWKNLQKLHKVRVTESSDVVTVDSCSSIDMMNLELLDLSGNTHMESLPTLSSAGNLKTLVLNGCSSLENVVLAMERGPPLLESFSFDGKLQKELPPEHPIARVQILRVKKISLHGCGRLQNIFLQALPYLEELDLSGTAIKILDLGKMDVQKLKKLFLVGCQHLRSLIWHGLPELEVLHVDTQGKKSMDCSRGQRSFGFHAFIAFTDGRFTWSSMEGVWLQTRRCLSKVYILISCMSHIQANITKVIKEIDSSQENLVPTSPYNNIALTKDATCSSLVWNYRQLQTLDIHIEIGTGSYSLEVQDNIYFRVFVSYVQSLHVHDNSSITTIPPAGVAYWNNLEWCHVERCPKLHSLFSCQGGRNFDHIRTFSASDLLMAYCIWGRGKSTYGFQELQDIYLYNCPSLVFVLPIRFTLPNLETIQIAYCSNLRHVFPSDNKYHPAVASGVTFENLKHIKLYHLHNLEQICEAKLTAPALQTVSIRDCWALRRLPAVARQGPKPLVDCEKDLWSKLEWDGLDAGHHPSLFETRHSAYCKKTLPKVSFLR